MEDIDSCQCCTKSFVAYEERSRCFKCGNVVCATCIRNVETKEDGVAHSQLTCKDCEFMGKWVNNVQAKSNKGTWKFRIPKGLFRKKTSSQNTDTGFNERFDKKINALNSLVENQQYDKKSQKLEVTVPVDIQKDLQQLSREKMKELIDQKKRIAELEAENAAIKAGNISPDQLGDVKKMIDELKTESQDHIAKLELEIQRLKTENIQLVSGGAVASGLPAPAAVAAPVVTEDPALAKYRKMQKAKLPEGAIVQAAARDGVQLPANFFTEEPPVAAPVAVAPPAVVQEDPKFAKYRKMQKASLPEGAIMQAAARDGVQLPANFFSEEPQAAAAPVAAPVVTEDPKFAKYRKMQKANLPEGAIMQAAARDGVQLPANFFSGEPIAAPAPAAAPVVVEDPKFAKYRKMQKANLPEGAIMQAAARDGVQLPANFFSGEPIAGAAAPAPVVEEDPKFAKYRKMQKANLPEGAIMQAAARDGVQLPANFFSGEPLAAAAPAPVVEEDPKFAKYRKMQKANLPEGAIVQAAARDGVQLPGNFFSASAPASAPAAAPVAAPVVAAAPIAPPKAPEPERHRLDVQKRKNQRVCMNASDQLRGIFWTVIPGERAESSMWTSFADAPPMKLDQEFKILEREFAKVPAKVVSKRPVSPDPSASAAKKSERPPLLDPQRQQNLGIGLARFKETAKELKKHILDLDQDFFTMEVTHKLLSLLPTAEEIQAIENARAEWQGPGAFESGLSREEEFVVVMSTIPRLRQRLQCLFVEMTFDRQSEALTESMDAYLNAMKTLKNSREWKKLLHVALSAGNYVNSGNKSTQGAWGFEVSSGLQKLAQSKSSANPKFTLLHWIALVSCKKSPELLRLAEQFKCLDNCRNMKIEDMKADLAQLSKGCELVEREVNACKTAAANNSKAADGSKEFIKIFSPFLKETGTPVVQQLKKRIADLEAFAAELLTMHGELPTKCSPTQLMITAYSFCQSLEKASEELGSMEEILDEKIEAPGAVDAKKAAPSNAKEEKGQAEAKLKAQKSNLAQSIADKIAQKRGVPHIQSA